MGNAGSARGSGDGEALSSRLPRLRPRGEPAILTMVNATTVAMPS